MESENGGRVEFITDTTLETKALGRVIGERCSGGELILLTGPLGAGKTTLVQGLAKGLGVPGPVQSPSFVLERVHEGRVVLRHLDLYRLSGQEIEDSGLLFEIQPDDVTVIEWADRAYGMPEADLHIKIEVSTSNPSRRKIQVKAMSPEWKSYLNGAKHGDRDC